MDDDEIVKEFLVESHENLDQLDQDLITLEADPTNPEMLSRIFRTIHTIKGTCGFLGFTKLEWVTHVGENLLSRLRDGQLQLSDEITTALLSLVDAVREILSSIENSGREGDADYESLTAELTRLHDSVPEISDAGDADVQQGAAQVPADVAEDSCALGVEAQPQPEAPIGATGEIDPQVQQYLVECHQQADLIDQELMMLETEPASPEALARMIAALRTLAGSSAAAGFTATQTASEAAVDFLAGVRDGSYPMSDEITTAILSMVDLVRQALVAIETSGSDDDVNYVSLIATLRRLQKSSSEVQPDAAIKGRTVAMAVERAEADTKDLETQESQQALAARLTSVADTSIRVDVGLLDTLMDQVGELVLARNRIMQFATIQEDRNVLAAYQRLDLITSELQEGVMKTRMQQIGTIWNKFPRVVRDLARDCGKKVNLSMEGEETELDRTLIEAIRDPLTHLVRNAVDHGIESPEDRKAAGKSEAGTLALRAFHEGGQVNISIADDGGGIDPQRILQRALERSLVSAGKAAQMSDREILDLIFAPGFSTAETVTNVSGRGVGMDVVKNNIERINGTIDIQSTIGQGSTIRIKIPLTLAIIPALIVRCHGDRYAIPQASLIELVRLEGEEAEGNIESIHGAPVYRLRGKLLPLVYLRDELARDGNGAPEHRSVNGQVTNIIVLQADQSKFGLVVEHVLDTEEIVVKPLGKQVKDIDVFAGATIMGDGNVALILDVLGLAQRAGVLSERGQALQADKADDDQSLRGAFQTLLLLENTAGQRMALPLSRVTRLEKFPVSEIERTGSRQVVQYWGQVMPLIHISSCLDGAAATAGVVDPPSDMLEVVVLSVQSSSIGLVVDRIIDTVEDVLEIQPLGSRRGVMGTVVVSGQVTELLDLDEIIRIAGPMISPQFQTLEAEG